MTNFFINITIIQKNGETAYTDNLSDIFDKINKLWTLVPVKFKVGTVNYLEKPDWWDSAGSMGYIIDYLKQKEEQEQTIQLCFVNSMKDGIFAESSKQGFIVASATRSTFLLLPVLHITLAHELGHVFGEPHRGIEKGYFSLYTNMMSYTIGRALSGAYKTCWDQDQIDRMVLYGENIEWKKF